MTAPERIWVAGTPQECGQYFPSCVEAEGAWGGVGVEYTRADLARPTLFDALALPEVKALVDALEAKTVMDPNNSNSTWLDAKARAALAALTTTLADGDKA